MRTAISLCSAVLCALSFFCFAAGQEIGYRNFGNRVDSEPVPPDDEFSVPGIAKWLPPEEFENEVREALSPAVTMSSVLTVAGREAPRRIYVLPNNALKLWRISVSNGSAGNWGAPPASFLDARTLSFPAPGR